MESYSRNQLIVHARCCEQTERYDEMREAMKKVVLQEEHKMSTDERNLLSVAYKNIVGARRSSWRALKNIQQLKKKEMYDEAVVANLMTKVFEELKSYSEEVIKLLDDHVFDNDTYKGGDRWYEDMVFFYKMKGDYLRYVAEVLENDTDEKKGYTDKASEAYLKAKELADANLECTSSIFLGLVLNFSVFYYEIADKKDEAISLAEKAFDNAIAQMEKSGADGSEIKDSALILQLLRDNLTLWKTPSQDDDDDDQDD